MFKNLCYNFLFFFIFSFNNFFFNFQKCMFFYSGCMIGTTIIFGGMTGRAQTVIRTYAEEENCYNFANTYARKSSLFNQKICGFGFGCTLKTTFFFQ
jgi:hypothetical protein